MCIIIVANIGVALPKRSVLEHCWDQNPHGGGLMYVDRNTNKVIIKKSKDKKEFIDLLETTHRLQNDKSPIVCHMRWVTKGDNSLDNTHPFSVNSKLAYCHNGTIAKEFINRDATKSDSQQLGIHMFQKLPPNWFRNSMYMHLMQHYIGASKIAMLTSKRKVVLLNDDWIEHEGVLYSNDYFKKEKVRGNTFPTIYEGGLVVSSGYRVKSIPYFSMPRFYDGPLHLHCEMCGIKPNEPQDLQAVMLKDFDNQHCHRMDLCPRCYSKFLEANNILFNSAERVCVTCRKIEGRNGPYTWKQFMLCYQFSTNPEKDKECTYNFRCMTCAYDIFRLGVKAASSGDAHWCVDKDTYVVKKGTFAIAEQLKGNK